jgi:hypothetical protein
MNSFKTSNPLKTLAAALALAALCGAAQADGSVVLSPVSSSVEVGSTFSVMVNGVGFTDNVVGGGFNLSFNPLVLSLNSVSINTAVWEFASSGGLIDNPSGTLVDVYFNSNQAVLPTGNFPIATLNFSALAEGSSALTLAASPDFPFANDNIEIINVSFGTGTVSVTAVPEPSTWATLALGLGVLPLVRRRLGHRA